jgi:hypothetical protein
MAVPTPKNPEPGTSANLVVPMIRPLSAPRKVTDPAETSTLELGVEVPIPKFPLLATATRSDDPIFKMTLPVPFASESPVMMASTAFERELIEPPLEAEVRYEPSVK